MIWLIAVLAFVITMLVFSTMISVFVEAGLRICLMRERGFEHMITRLFEDVVKPRLKSQLSLIPDSGRADFKEKLAHNRAMPLGGSGRIESLRRWFVPRTNTTMTVAQFAERLADTEAGKAIAAQAANGSPTGNRIPPSPTGAPLSE